MFHGSVSEGPYCCIAIPIALCICLTIPAFRVSPMQLVQ